MTTTTDELRKMMVILCNHFDKMGNSEIHIPVTYYWDIPKEELYDSYEEPSTHTLGDLDEDMDQLKKTVNNHDKAIGYGFVWLSNILRAIGYNVPC